MRVPGGPVRGVAGPRTVRVAAPTGRLERLLDEPAERGDLPARVTAVLAGAILDERGDPVGEDWCRRLSAGDRRFLLRQVMIAMGRGTAWQTLRCTACRAAFDVPIDHCALQPPPVGSGWPVASVEGPGGPMRIRAIMGEDEEAVARLEASEAVFALLRRCVVDEGAAPVLADHARIDAALEELGPHPVLTVSTHCPECDAEQTAGADPYVMVGRGEEDLIDDVHRLAAAYGWSESDILSLPTARRRAYLRLVDAPRSVFS